MNIFQKWFKKVREGFTLIELLVAVAIIGILAALIVINISGARAKAITSKVMEDVNALARAAEIARTTGTLGEVNGSFRVSYLLPEVSGAYASYCGVEGDFAMTNLDDSCLLGMQDLSGNSLIKQVPKHPMPGESYAFHSVPTGGGYYTIRGKIAEKTTSSRAPRYYVATTGHSGVKLNIDPLDGNDADKCMVHGAGPSTCTVSDPEDDTNTNGSGIRSY